MLTYEKSLEFRYFREMSIVFLARNSKMPVQKILQKKLRDFEQLSKFFTDTLLVDYKTLRDEIQTEEPWLFCTDDGNLYASRKLAQNIRFMLEKSGMPTQPTHPNKMTIAQVEALQGLQFSYQRPSFQQALAGAMLGLQAMRPEEVAGLFKGNIDLPSQTILLEDTKSQKPQTVPIHPDLIKPLTTYLAHLETHEPLFVRNTGAQWNRKDVHHAASKIASRCGLENINPRRLRSTVGHEMISAGIPLNVISRVLRHSDEATAPRHYTYLEDVSAVRNVFNQYRPVSTHTETQG